jgi:hypothetical protein
MHRADRGQQLEVEADGALSVNMRNIFAAVVVTGAAGGLFAGGFLTGRAAAREGPAPGQAQQRELEEIRASAEALGRAVSLLAALRSAPVHSACPGGSSTVAESAPRAATEAPPVAPPAPAAQEEASLREAEALFADASSRGQWTSADDEAFQQLRVASPALDWAPFELGLAAAVNAGRLQRSPRDEPL